MQVEPAFGLSRWLVEIAFIEVRIFTEASLKLCKGVFICGIFAPRLQEELYLAIGRIFNHTGAIVPLNYAGSEGIAIFKPKVLS